ncbi:hypothetical protein ZEAMMB73_Zm00001d053748 [Zea mays]|uniref:Uncharacterized protein n=1 Tax=Zea mays TaxID=4577 RepID=A0A1D6QRZ6_MAIZE|nr:hypothetical protein ZEAMMB73_Zm00001d053748 [Zea mays]
MAASSADELVAAAAGIICSMRGADLAAGWAPPRRKQQEPAREGALIWPAVARGKRSRRRSPSAGFSSSGKARWGGRASPASTLDYSGGSGSGSGSGSAASTSGGEDGGFCSLPHRPVGATDRPQLIFPTPPLPRLAGQRPRKKLRLPEMQQLVRSLAVDNERLREVTVTHRSSSQEMRDLQGACEALSKENDELETRLGQSSRQSEVASKEQRGKGLLDPRQPARDSFALPDLNLPPQDSADVSTVSLIAPDHPADRHTVV